jgi:hypothetical protein
MQLRRRLLHLLHHLVLHLDAFIAHRVALLQHEVMRGGAALACLGFLSATTGCGLVLDLDPPDDGIPPSRDAGTLDASRADGSVARDAALDARTLSDGSQNVDGGGCPATGCEIACAPPGPGSAGSLVLGTSFWVAFRFQIPPGPTVTLASVGLTAQNGTAAAHTLFGAIVALSGPGDYPDTPTLQSADVLGTTVMNLPQAATTTTSGPLSLSLAPGWYAAVFGGGAFGGTLTSGSAPSQSDSLACINGLLPFNIRTSDGQFSGQGASPHLFVILAP